MKEYYIVKRKAVPDVLIKVAEVDRLLESGKAMTVQEATELLGISRSSYYKYKGDIMPFHDQARGKTITFMLQINDEPGGLSLVLNEVARCHANVLTINQSIPINGIAPVTLNLEIQP
ncbi:MAG: ACT domain-containing protein, partial [Acetivibrio ethanolgignens]